MKYIVSLKYTEFCFDDPAEAIAFANTAKKAYRADKYDKELAVTIELVSDEEKEEEED